MRTANTETTTKEHGRIDSVEGHGFSRAVRRCRRRALALVAACMLTVAKAISEALGFAGLKPGPSTQPRKDISLTAPNNCQVLTAHGWLLPYNLLHALQARAKDVRRRIALPIRDWRAGAADAHRGRNQTPDASPRWRSTARRAAGRSGGRALETAALSE